MAFRRISGVRQRPLYLHMRILARHLETPDLLDRCHYAGECTMRKHVKRTVLANTGIGILVLTLILVSATLSAPHATTYAVTANARLARTINGLSRIAMVGSTAFIVDAKGRTITVDANPYGVTIVPTSHAATNASGSLKVGDMLVSNIGANDTGTTLVRFSAHGGPGFLFNTVADPGTKGPIVKDRRRRRVFSHVAAYP